MLDTKVTEMLEVGTYRVPGENWPELQARLDKLIRRAVKLGLAPIEVTVQREEHVLYTGNRDSRERIQNKDETLQQAQERAKGDPNAFIRRFHHIEVRGVAPKLNGWEFVATIQHLDGENILAAIPTYEGTIPQVYRTRGPEHCDHCHKRIRRNDTYVVQHDSGTFQQVGKNCLRDFTGHDNPQALASYAELLLGLGTLCGGAEDDDFFAGSGYCKPLYDLDRFLAETACAIRLQGWVSRGKARNEDMQATADLVVQAFHSPLPLQDEWLREFLKKFVVEDSDRTAASTSREWARDLSPQEDSDYLANIRVVARQEVIEIRHTGLAASIVSSYQRKQRKDVEDKERAKRPRSCHFGTLKQRGTYVLTVVSMTSFEGSYGLTTCVRFVDDKGNEAAWFASGGCDLEEGRTYQVKATIKKHDVWKDRQQTVVTRVKVLGTVDADRRAVA